MNNQKLNDEKREKIYVMLILMLAICVRFFQFGTIPCGLNQDEAYAGYEAFSLLTSGTDSYGYANPCYLIAWGSGMNVLETYFIIPAMKLFGNTVFAVRLPQLIFGCISLPVFYCLVKKMFSKQEALWGLGMLAISPWHIMLSRWALESNLAPAFLLFGFYFFVKGIDKNQYWILSALFYGLSLYCYAITWAVVPITILLFAGYLLLMKKKISWGKVFISCIVLFSIALPLCLFVLVNMGDGLIAEIVTPYFSIPKLVTMRSAELSVRHLLDRESYINFLKVFLLQKDGLPWNSTARYGMFYFISIPFILIGGLRFLFVSFQKIKNKTFSYEVLVLSGMVCSVVVCLMTTNLNINKANSLHFYTLILLAAGIATVIGFFKENKLVKTGIGIIFIVSFVCFSVFYFTKYNDMIKWYFRYGVEDAVSFVNEKEFDRVYVDPEIYYPQLLFYDEISPETYRATVKYKNFSSAYIQVASFDKYVLEIDYETLDKNSVYIVPGVKIKYFVDAYNIVIFGEYAVAYPNQ